MKTDNLVLVGLMGCGKTTVGSILAARLGWTFIDTDIYIEEQEGKTINQIFIESGEPAFREIERNTMAVVGKRSKQVIATGGGIVKDQRNVDALGENGTIFYMKWQPEPLYEHVKDDTNRPLLLGYEGIERLGRIEQLYEERRDMYLNAADVIYVCDGQNAEEVADGILESFWDSEK